MLENSGHRVVIASDRDEMRRAVAGILDRESDIPVVGEVDVDEDLVGRVRDLHPDVLVVDSFSCTQVLMGTIDEVMAGLPGVHVVVICPWNDSRYAVWALSAGVSAYVVTKRALRDLLRAVRAAARQRNYVSPGIAGISDRG